MNACEGINTWPEAVALMGVAFAVAAVWVALCWAATRR